MEGSVEKGFIDDCICDSSRRFFLRITENIFQHFTPFNYSYSSTAATKRNTAAIKIILLLEDDSFIWFGLRKTSPRVQVELAGSRVQETFRAFGLLAYRRYIRGE